MGSVDIRVWDNSSATFCLRTVKGWLRVEQCTIMLGGERHEKIRLESDFKLMTPTCPCFEIVRSKKSRSHSRSDFLGALR